MKAKPGKHWVIAAARMCRAPISETLLDFWLWLEVLDVPIRRADIHEKALGCEAFGLARSNRIQVYWLNAREMASGRAGSFRANSKPTS